MMNEGYRKFRARVLFWSALTTIAIAVSFVGLVASIILFPIMAHVVAWGLAILFVAVFFFSFVFPSIYEFFEDHFSKVK